jgi:hypothetical protein
MNLSAIRNQSTPKHDYLQGKPVQTTGLLARFSKCDSLGWISDGEGGQAGRARASRQAEIQEITTIDWNFLDWDVEADEFRTLLMSCAAQ